jgi:hypothetical protein
MGFARRLFCRHRDYDVIREEALGVTLSWEGQPTVLYRWPCRCRRCGKAFNREGILPPNVEAIGRLDHGRDTDGWPLDRGGTRMRVARL